MLDSVPLKRFSGKRADPSKSTTLPSSPLNFQTQVSKQH